MPAIRPGRPSIPAVRAPRPVGRASPNPRVRYNRGWDATAGERSGVLSVWLCETRAVWCNLTSVAIWYRLLDWNQAYFRRSSCHRSITPSGSSSAHVQGICAWRKPRAVPRCGREESGFSALLFLHAPAGRRLRRPFCLTEPGRRSSIGRAAKSAFADTCPATGRRSRVTTSHAEGCGFESRRRHPNRISLLQRLASIDGAGQTWDGARWRAGSPPAQLDPGNGDRPDCGQSLAHGGFDLCLSRRGPLV